MAKNKLSSTMKTLKKIEKSINTFITQCPVHLNSKGKRKKKLLDMVKNLALETGVSIAIQTDKDEAKTQEMETQTEQKVNKYYKKKGTYKKRVGKPRGKYKKAGRRKGGGEPAPVRAQETTYTRGTNYYDEPYKKYPRKKRSSQQQGQKQKMTKQQMLELMKKKKKGKKEDEPSKKEGGRCCNK